MFLVIAYFLFLVFERVWKACLKDSLPVENIDVEMHRPWAVITPSPEYDVYWWVHLMCLPY
jgi:hypothetical protein